eukprot:4175673-Pleurochrysis_carterae.AAC.1
MNEFGPRGARAFIGAHQRVVNHWIVNRGYSIGARATTNASHQPNWACKGDCRCACALPVDTTWHQGVLFSLMCTSTMLPATRGSNFPVSLCVILFS